MKQALWAAFFSPRKETRQPRRDLLASVEHLESRLCLGSLTAPIVSEPTIPAIAEPAILLEQKEEANFSEITRQLFPAPETPQPDHQTSEDIVASSTEAAQPLTPPPAIPNILDKAIAPQQLGPSLSVVETSPETSTHANTLQAVPAIDSNPTPLTPDPAADKNSGTAHAALPQVAEVHGNARGTESNDAANSANNWNADSLASYGYTLDADGRPVTTEPWWKNADQPIVIRYDFRNSGGYDNVITDEQMARAMDAMHAWSVATGGMIQFERDTTSPDSQILNIGVGDLAAFQHTSGPGGAISLGGGQLITVNDQPTVNGAIWFDQDEQWDVTMGNGDVPGTFDFFTAAAHETGHAIGITHTFTSGSLMYGRYVAELGPDAVSSAAQSAAMDASFYSGATYEVSPLMGPPQLMSAEVTQLLERAAAATNSSDAIIAIVDRGGHILGVRTESDVLTTITDTDTLVFAIDGAVAKARTAAFFANGDLASGTGPAPLTSRTIQFISQSTVTEREVNSNPNAEMTSATNTRTAADVYASTLYGPGFVAPIGLGAHFPPEVNFTPPVDLFAIEHTNRDSLILPGPDNIKGTGDDVTITQRFNATFLPNQEIDPPESYGAVSESGLFEKAQSRGIATLPGGVPIYRDTNLDGIGDTLIGGIGVFFPGPDGFASFEQNFIPGADQTTFERLNAPKVLEAEYIAYAALGGSLLAQQMGIDGAVIGDLDGVPRITDIDIPFGRIDLVGINLPLFGPIAGREGLERLLDIGEETPQGSAADGMDQPVNAAHVDGDSVPQGYLVAPANGVGGLTAADVQQIIQQGIDAANEVRAAIRLPRGSRTKMVFAVTDLQGNVIGLYRMEDATFFSIDVAVAKARNVTYYANAAEIDPFDQVVDPGAALTNRTFRFLAGPRYPDGIDGTPPGPFSILNHPQIDDDTAENIGGPATAGTFDPTVNPNTASVLGFDAFFPNTNFQDSTDTINRNGIVFFPGSVPIYKNGVLVGGLGVSGDGVDQDDVVTYFASKGFEPPNPLRADMFFVRDVRLPYIKFLRNPFG